LAGLLPLSGDASRDSIEEGRPVSKESLMSNRFEIPSRYPTPARKRPGASRILLRAAPMLVG
jgi:hypothetical protein